MRFRAPGAFLYHTRFGRGDPASTEPHGVVLVVPRQADYWAPVDRQRLLLFAGRTPVVNGRNDLILASRSTHVERLYLVNAAPRILSLRLPGTTMKLVGADRGRLEREAFVESVLLAPFERAVVEVLFPHAGHFRLEHRRPGSSVVLCSFHVRSGTGRGAGRPADFERLRDAPEFDDLRRELPSLLAREPALVLAVADAPSAVVPLEAGRERTGWKVRLVHRPSDGRGHRLVHVEGGRFLVLARDGLPTPTLAGKDTLLLRVGEVVDVLLVPFGTSPAALHLIDADGLERYRSVSIVDGAGIAPGPGGRSGR